MRLPWKKKRPRFKLRDLHKHDFTNVVKDDTRDGWPWRPFTWVKIKKVQCSCGASEVTRTLTPK